jgi:protein ImuB
MAFASIFVPNFLLQSVVRAESALRERGLALIDGDPPLSRVIAIDEAAAQMGIEIGMTKTEVEQFANVEIRPRFPMQENIAHAALLDIGWSISPRIEDTALDAIVLDLSGLTSLFGTERDIGAQIVERSTACGLRGNVAIASNIDTALIAARGFAGVTVILPGKESQYLSGLPISTLLPSNDTAEILSRWGMTTCADLARLPILDLSERLGQEGVSLHAQARGAFVRSLVIAEPAHCFEEEMELEDAVEELEPLSFLLGRLLDQLCARLTARSLGVAVLRVRFELQPSFDTAVGIQEAFRTQQRPGLYDTEMQLPVPMRDSKMLLKLLRLRLQGNPPGAPIQKITLAADAARPRATEGSLFLPSSPDPEKLELTIARIAHVVGEGNVGSPSLTDTYRPGDFQMRRFLIPREASLKNRARHTANKCADDRIPVSFRVFRPALPATLDFDAGCPARVAFQGLRGEVSAASGPWRTSGDWWREDLWQQDEWDLEIHFQGATKRRDRFFPSGFPPNPGIYRFFYDSLRRGWFVRGIYD